jgi:hypothetical protein
MSPEPIVRHPLVEEILARHADHARGDASGWAGYRGHVYRVLTCAQALAPDAPGRTDRLAVAAAFHDLDVFATLDYLGSSIDAALAWLAETGREEWGEEVARLIAFHHHPRAYSGPYAETVEAFRRADWNDVLQGTLRFGVPRELMRATRREHPVGTFFTGTVRRAGVRWALARPGRLPPILFARRALRGRRLPPAG